MNETKRVPLPRIETVTVAIVARNEAATIGAVFEDIKAQEFPHDRMEVLLIDSASTDETKLLMKEFERDDVVSVTPFRRVAVLDNPRKILPAGCNVMLEHYTGDALVRIDAHARIPADFVVRCVEVLEEGECVCGGPRPTVAHPSTSWSETLLVAEESAFGSSIADYRKGVGNRYVSSAFHAMFRREVIETVGVYDERLVRTEDNDYFYRVRQAGYHIRFDDRVRSEQIARNTFSRMIKQKYGNGFWIGKTLKIAPKCVSTFHLVPFAFVVALIACLAVGFAWSWVPLLALCGLYLAVDLSISVLAIIACRKRYAQMLALPLIFPAIHLSYGWGTLRGIFGLDGR